MKELSPESKQLVEQLPAVCREAVSQRLRALEEDLQKHRAVSIQLATAYQLGTESEHVAWEDVDMAAELAAQALGEAAIAEIGASIDAPKDGDESES